MMFDAQFQENAKVLGEIKDVEGIEKGRKIEYDSFWDGFQNKGERKEYSYAFVNWHHEEIKPKYPIYSALLNQFCYGCKAKKIPDKIYPTGAAFGYSYAAFSNCTNLEEINFDLPFKATDKGTAANLFYNCQKLVTIKKISFDNFLYNFSNTFYNCTSLRNVTFGGKIASTIDFTYCPLSVESAKSIILALEDYRDTAYDSAFTCLFNEATWALLDADDTSPYDTWRNYFVAVTWNY